MTTTAVLVVRNEEAILHRCLESAATVCDRYVIVDTGSTDGTEEIARAWLKTHDGKLHQRPWEGFGPTRTEALRLAGGAGGRLLILDADMTVEGSLQGPLPRADKLMLTIRDNSEFEYRLPLLITDRPDWRYEGVTHEYLTADSPTSQQNLNSLTVTHHCDGARRPEKLYSDLALLAAEFAHNPGDERTVFYLAQTHRDLGNIDEAIMFYRLRAEMGGWDEEAFYARYQLGCLLAAHVSFDQGADELLQAWRDRPTRIESLRALAHSANAVADKAAASDDVLFVHRDLYAD